MERGIKDRDNTIQNLEHKIKNLEHLLHQRDEEID